MFMTQWNKMWERYSSGIFYSPLTGHKTLSTAQDCLECSIWCACYKTKMSDYLKGKQKKGEPIHHIFKINLLHDRAPSDHTFVLQALLNGLVFTKLSSNCCDLKKNQSLLLILNVWVPNLYCFKNKGISNTICFRRIKWLSNNFFLFW